MGRKYLFIAFIVAFLVISLDLWALDVKNIVMYSGESKIFTFFQINKVHVVDPNIAQVIAVSANELVVNAKAQGKTDIYVWDKTGRNHIRVEVKKTVREIQKKVNELIGPDKVKVSFENNSLFLRGTVDSQEQIAELLRLATVYSRKIVNLLKVKGEETDYDKMIKDLNEIIGNKKVKVEVKDGKFIVKGDVSSQAEKQKLLDSIRSYIGRNREIVDLINVSSVAFSRAEHIKKAIGIKGVEIKIIYAGSIIDSTITGEARTNLNVDLDNSNGNYNILLTGKVSTEEERMEAEKIAKAFNPNVINTLEIEDPYQVLIDAKIVEISESGKKDLGIEWGYNKVSVDGDTITYDDAPHTGILRYMEDIRFSPYGDIKRYGPEISSSLNPFKTGNFNRWDPVMFILNFLINEGKAKLLSNPKLVTVSGKKATLKVGGQIPVEVHGENNSITIEWKDYGIILEVTPYVNSEGNVTVEIHSEVSNLDYANASKTRGIPAITQKTANTKVFVHDKDTIVLSGLISTATQNTEVKTPILGDIPFLGKLFKHKNSTKRKSELMIFLTPRIVNYQKGRVKFSKTKPVISINPENIKLKKVVEKNKNSDIEKSKPKKGSLRYKVNQIFKNL